jgi:hypothetical protein
VFFPWSKFHKKEYDDKIAWVLERIEFDIDHNKFWMDRWGNRPVTLSAALDVARKDIETWPKLLPIYHHRFLAAEPCRSGNPVLSIMGTDIVYYGSNLAHYLLNEFVDLDQAAHANAREIQRIRIWSYLAEDGNAQLDDC